jgi:hypothetical protein
MPCLCPKLEEERRSFNFFDNKLGSKVELTPYGCYENNHSRLVHPPKKKKNKTKLVQP